MAPHIARDWADAVVVELRLLDVGETRISAALAEVDTHCSESGQEAQQEFGDPVKYARSLDLPPDDALAPTRMVVSALPTGLQIIGMLLTLWGFTAWRNGQPLELTAGQCVIAVGLLLVTAAVARWIDPVLRTVIEHPMRAWTAFMVATAVSVAPVLVLTAVVARVPAVGTMAWGVVVLAAGAAWGLVQARTDIGASSGDTRAADAADATDATAPPDTAGPTDDAAGAGEPGPGPTVPLTRARIMTVLVTPIWTVIALAVTWWLTS